VQLDIFALPRKYRQSRLAVIATRDLASNNHIQTLQQTSQLARLLINFAYDTATAEFVQKYGKVINSQGELQKFIIFALGKLGGNELNYSSDVDLVFCYSGNGVSDGKKTIDAQSYFNRLGRRIIQILDSATGTGIVYRVDMRLRPFGSASPLACSIDNLLGYLETEGRDWERYAWLRASFVAGAATIARTVLNDIRPFIYRKYLDYGIFASLRQIKEQITRKQQNDLNNLKLGKGGIREIEFIIQTLQLTFAGRNKQLRSNNLYQQMHKLCEFRHLTVKELQQLTAAWLFLRRLENLCQIIHDTSSHHLPQNQEALVECMGLLTTYELQKKLQIHRDNVHHIFKQLFLTNQSKDHKPISNPQIQQIKDDIASKNFPKTSKHKMYAALDAIIPLLTKYDNSDTIIQRYQQVINAVSKRPSYLSMLIESPVILAKLIRQIAHSKYFSDSIAAMPSLLEILFDTLDEDDFVISLQWQQFAQKHNLDNSEQYLEVLCQFKQRMQFKAIMASVDKSHNSQITGKILTDLAEHILALVIAQAWQQIKQNTASTITTDALIVIAYGSMAMQDMHLQSDFDLVFILNQDITTTNHKFIMRWMKRIIHLLSIKTYFGSLYQLDTQLRPNGNAGAAIVTQSNFETYQLNDAWLWEHAALIKSRAVYANKEQKYWFQNLRKQVLT
ncbi:Glutamate-ammonia-ligase adenylyltransferase, partial [hydrothermal vent metagenome]